MAETSTKPKKGSKQAQLDAVAAQVKVCTLCPLWKSRTNAVPGVGNPEADIVFIGEGPGWHEDQQALPFVGPSGQLLDRMLASIGIQRADVFITNIVKCRPPQNRDPLPHEIETCHPYLQAQLDIIRPRLIVTLGRHSMNLFLPDAKITQVHGQPQRTAQSGMMIVPMFHPAAALRTPAWMTALKEDFQKLPALLKELDDQPLPTLPQVTAESPAAAVVAAALEEVSPTVAEAIIAPEVLAEVNEAADSGSAAPKVKRGKKTTVVQQQAEAEPDKSSPPSDDSDAPAHRDVAAQSTTPAADEPTAAPAHRDVAAQSIVAAADEPTAAPAYRDVAAQSMVAAADEPEAEAKARPRRGKKVVEAVQPAAAEAAEPTAEEDWEELTGAVEASVTERRRGRPHKAAAPAPDEQPAPNATSEPAKPRSSRRQKEEDAGQMTLF